MGNHIPQKPIDTNSMRIVSLELNNGIDVCDDMYLHVYINICVCASMDTS